MGTENSAQPASSGGVYSNSQILDAIKRGHIVCQPFHPQQVNGASLNVTLGRWYYKTEYDLPTSCYNPFSEEEVNKYFRGPFEAAKHRDWAKQARHQLFDNIPANQQIIVLEPRQRILAHTHEFVGIRAPGTSQMLARSTWGRNGVSVCIDAGWGDPGYINRWTMEICNFNQHHSVVLPVGEQLAQIVFYHSGPVDGSYETISGTYQAAGDLRQVIKEWQPTAMLPRAHTYKRRALRPLDVQDD